MTQISLLMNSIPRDLSEFKFKFSMGLTSGSLKSIFIQEID